MLLLGQIIYIKYIEKLCIPDKKLKVNTINQYMGPEMKKTPPAFLPEGIQKKKWQDKYQNKIPSVIIWIWDFVILDFIENFEDHLATYIDNKQNLVNWKIKCYFVIKLPQDVYHELYDLFTHLIKSYFLFSEIKKCKRK